LSLHAFGDLVLASQVPLPALPISRETRSDLSFRVKAVAPYRGRRWDHHWYLPGGAVSLSCARFGEDYRLGFPGSATFEIRDEATAVECIPERSLPANTVEHLLIDQVLPRVLTHHGRLVLHAGCVGIDGRAVLLLGESGAGKSTLCASLATFGHVLLGDDGVWLRRVGAGSFEVAATYPGLRLRPEPLAFHYREAGAFDPVADTSDKRRVPTPELAGARLPLHRVYVLAAPGTGSVRVGPLRGADAFVALLSATFQLHLDDPGRASAMFDGLGDLIDTVPVRTLAYPRTYDRLPEVREAILDDLAV